MWMDPGPELNVTVGNLQLPTLLFRLLLLSAALRLILRDAGDETQDFLHAR